MTLATRCPACHTTFKVVKDQLRLADGWVRCGRCEEVFLAADAMALSQQAPEPATVQAPTEDAPGQPALAPDQADLGPSTAAPASALPPEQLPEQPPEPIPDPSPEPLPEPVPEPPVPARPYVWDTASAQRLPRSPWATAGWSVLAGLGVATLVTQAALAWHDELLHAAPVLKPVLEVACVMADCRLEPVRRLQALSVEASQLSQLGGTIYQFNATVRNRSDSEVAAPAFDLVLTGNDGQVIARKALRWADFGLRNRSMAAQQEVSLQTNLNTGTTAVAGFTIELFYP